LAVWAVKNHRGGRKGAAACGASKTRNGGDLYFSWRIYGGGGIRHSCTALAGVRVLAGPLSLPVTSRWGDSAQHRLRLCRCLSHMV